MLAIKQTKLFMPYGLYGLRVRMTAKLLRAAHTQVDIRGECHAISHHQHAFLLEEYALIPGMQT